MRKAAAPSWPKVALRSSVVMREMRKAGCSLWLKDEPQEQSDDEGDEEGWLLPMAKGGA
jgi:hypothetical protein